jgi:DNA invertase Pin-like site-specific DNA recombinase
MKQIAVYVRASTSRQDTGLDAQRRAIDAFIQSKGYDAVLVRIYEDNGYTGANKKRPALTDLIQHIQNGTVGKVICYSFSRISRSIRDLLDIVDLFEKQGVEFYSLSENVDTSSPMGRCFLGIIAALNQAEREILSERTKNGLKAAKLRGAKLGAKKTVDTAMILRLANEGLSHREIARVVGCSPSSVCRELKAAPQKTYSATG